MAQQGCAMSWRVASNKEVVSNLMGITETDRECAHELHGHALVILRELAFDDPVKKQEFNKLFKTLLCILLEKAEEPNNNIVKVEQAYRESYEAYGK